MKLIDNNFEIKNNSIVALGLFDGVHLGHRKVIEHAIKHKKNLSVIVFTFTTKNQRPTKKIDQRDIFDADSKLEALSNLNVDYTYMPDFDVIKNLTPLEFVRDILHNKLKAKEICCGNDFRFGKQAAGDITLLQKLCSEHDIIVHIVEPKLYENQIISSTRIREAISNGNIELANGLLGFDYFINQEVVFGKQLGRTIECPTINQEFNSSLCIPKYGVYISVAHLDRKKYPSITNVGIKPTIIGDRMPLAETHIIGIDQNLYGEKIKIDFKKFIREETKFQNVSALSERIKKDIDQAKKYFKY